MELPFIICIGKNDPFLGPQVCAISKSGLDYERFEIILKDIFSIKTKYVLLDYPEYYAQGLKVNVRANEKDAVIIYAILILRDNKLPRLTVNHLENIEGSFLKMPRESTFHGDINVEEAKRFFKSIINRYSEKKAILPLEAYSHKIRGEITTIFGLCEFIIKHKVLDKPDKNFIEYIKIMLESCNELNDVLERIT
ncbi:MAG: hypothetical protein ACTSUE_09340 [Promethearchaeota archaeon]